MLKTLMKKQLSEVGAFLNYDAKKGQRRSKKNKIGYIALLIFIFGYLSVIFYFAAAWMGGPMIEAGFDWLFFLVMILLTTFLGVFGSVFNTFSSVYLAKDNEMLLAMPIKKRDLLIARLAGIYVMGIFYMCPVYIPTMLVAGFRGGFTVKGVVFQLIVLIVLSFVTLALSALLGWLVAIISVRLRSKAFVTVFVSLLFIAAYYYVYFKATAGIRDLLNNLDKIAVSVKAKGYLLYRLGMAPAGDFSSIIMILAITVLLCGVVYYLLWVNFTKILIYKKGEKRVAYKSSAIIEKSAEKSLLHKEVQRFTKSAGYMLNCGLGCIMLPILAIVVLVKGPAIAPRICNVLPEHLAAVMIAGMVCLMATMNDITAPSISMEGKSLWILQSLPVSSFQVLKAKLKLHIYVTLPPVLLCAVCIGRVMKINIVDMLWLLLISALFVLLEAETGLLLGLKLPNLAWTNENAALKQNMGVFIALFGGWGFIAVVGTIYYLLRKAINPVGFMIASAVIIFGLCVLLYRWLKVRGSRIFESL
ncbi:hypothetical protein [[Clostridium] polysaccharolyticum]|uniref:ABC-2 type transport system permease protein n=1 Tax=[Clostridium] polysaccharolyticum TaxID=29364 RepID=A0A1I0G5R9_9FIRM|nr:hypothetical protein [[Clostridium] polysaccharolyticum]SET65228.1 ABC-2 type transport system permease protein [[Clostridium] polysaccharolyticum]